MFWEDSLLRVEFRRIETKEGRTETEVLSLERTGQEPSGTRIGWTSVSHRLSYRLSKMFSSADWFLEPSVIAKSKLVYLRDSCLISETSDFVF